MIWLWIAAAVLSAGAAALMVQRAARSAKADVGENSSLAVYRRQMAEIDDLAARGLLTDADRRGVRAETGRRLLAAADRREAPLRTAPPPLTLAIAALVPLTALGAYLAVGAPGFPDQPFAQRLRDWRNTPLEQLTSPELAALMRAAAAQNPGDPGPLYFMAKYELDAGQPLEADQALDRAIALAPRRGDLWDLKGDVAIALSRDETSPAAHADFLRALALDPKAPSARFHLALDAIRGGDLKGGLAQWRALDADLDPADPRRPALASAIAQVEQAGPAALAAAAAAPPASISASPMGGQIQAMVDGLAARLKTNPDDPAGWVRLVRAYTVLGETPRRDAALAQARRRYATQPDVLRQLDGALAPAT
jgi:cytochrome c-type biogenesis protein CcmH